MFFDTENVRDGKKRLYILGPSDGRKEALRECENAVAYKMSGNGSLRSWYFVLCLVLCWVRMSFAAAGGRAISTGPGTTSTTRAATGPVARTTNLHRQRPRRYASSRTSTLSRTATTTTALRLYGASSHERLRPSLAPLLP